MQNNTEILSWLEEYYLEKEDKAKEIEEEIANIVDSWNLIMKEKIDTTNEAIQSFPFLISFMKSCNCKYVREDKNEKNILDDIWIMKYYEWEHFWTRYFIVENNWQTILEIPWKIVWDSEFLLKNQLNNQIKPISEYVDSSTEYIIIFFDNSDPNEKEMIIKKI